MLQYLLSIPHNALNVPCGGVSKLMKAFGPQTTESECLAATDTLQLQYAGTPATSMLSLISLVAVISLLCTQNHLSLMP